MTAAEEMLADLSSHHIEGIARAAVDAGNDGAFHVPLISHIEDNLYVGGCAHGVHLPDGFRYVVSLYPWERYDIGPDTTRFEVRMFDSAHVDDGAVLEAAELVNRCRARGKTLVHCQAGLNRSNLVAAFALMLAGRAAGDAIALLRARRSPVVLCNVAFETWLRTRAPRALPRNVHAVDPRELPPPGRCAWSWHWEDVDLRCTDNPIPGEALCAEHLIQASHEGTSGGTA